MPHIVAKKIELPSFPFRRGELEYLWKADAIDSNERLIGVRYEDLQFLLEIKQKEGRYVIKADKVTRPAPTYIVKMALKNFCEEAECEVLHDNLSTIKPSHIQKAQEFLKNIDYFIHHFPKHKEVWIEVGFGSGRHLLYQAKSHPDILFVGIEVHKPSIEQLLGQIALQKLDNILVLDYDARLFMEFVPSNIVGKIFVHFPVPWDKKPHRRVISKAFLSEAKRILKPGGILELRTDSKNYFDYALEIFLDESKAKLEVTKNIEPPISSKYEDRWVRLGKDIYDIRFENLESSDELKLDMDFSFRKGASLETLMRLVGQTKVYDDFFIHFQKLYQIDEKRYLLELSFGSFDRPEHKYLLMEEDTIQYFPKPPVPSKANKKAHIKIEESLHA